MNDFIKTGQSNNKEVENELEQHIALVLQQAEKNHSDGQGQSAAEIYRAILEIQPHNAQANYKLGVMSFELKQYHEALPFFRVAVETSPKTPIFWHNYIETLLLAKQHNNAEKALDLAEKYCKQNVELKKLRRQVNNIQARTTSNKDQIHPTVAPTAPKNKRTPSRTEIEKLAQLERKKSFKEIESFAKQLVERYPSDRMGWRALALAARNTDRAADGITILSQAINALPEDVRIRCDLASLLRDCGLYEEAEEQFQTALILNPDDIFVILNFNSLLAKFSRTAEQEQLIRRAIAIEPNAEIHYNLANILSTQGKILDAEYHLRQSLELSPEGQNARIQLGTILRKQGRISESIEQQRIAVKAEPEVTNHIDNLLFSLTYSTADSTLEALKTAKEFGKLVQRKAKNNFKYWLCNPRPERIRVGIVSADLYSHPVGFFLKNTIININDEVVDIIFYSNGIKSDDVTTSLKSACSKWRNINDISDELTAKLIHQDGIHILIDLSGHSAGNRLPLFAYKAAPVQAAWLGYFATTGVEEIDYILVDETGVPSTQRDQFSEDVWYLPNTRMCFTPPDLAGPVAPLPASRNIYITFGCFQNRNKVGDEVLKEWAKILAGLPSSRLRWQAPEFNDNLVKAQILNRFIELNIPAARITLHPSSDRKKYLQAYEEVDLLLDTFPFTGGTTTCEALWMGVPTLTLAGETLISRQGASMLTAAGLANWVVYSKVNYVNKAIEFASNTKDLSTLRKQLRQQVLASPLFDAKLFARNFETALWGMWEATKPDPTYLQVFEDDVKTASPIKQERPLVPKDKIKLARSEKKVNTNLIINKNPSIAQKAELVIVSATRLTQEIFWEVSALGISLKRHMAKDTRLAAKICFENTRGLSEVFNDSILNADEEQTLVFIHDDVWINQNNFLETVMAGLERFDVIGVIGNKRRLKNQTGWRFLDIKQKSDRKANLSGRLAFGLTKSGIIQNFGPAPVTCELLDGVFMAAKKSTLINSNVEFDTQFDFSFYDMDFCRTARQKNLKLGTWLLDLTHQSQGQYGTSGWHNNLKKYQEKWEEKINSSALENTIDEAILKASNIYKSGKLATAQYLYNEVLKYDPSNKEVKANLNQIQYDWKKIRSEFLELRSKLQNSIKLTIIVDLVPDVILLFENGLKYQQAGDNERAKAMYTEVLSIEPMHAESQHNLAFIEIGSQGLRNALPRFAAAISSEPSIDRYWVSYINVLLDIGAIATASAALKIGRNYGLTQQSEINILSVMGQGLNSEGYLFTRKAALNDISFIIVSPPYWEQSSGIVILHQLCDRLNRLGHKTGIVFITKNGLIRSDDINWYGKDLLWQSLSSNDLYNNIISNGVIIYPELVIDNPLQANHVARYYVNRISNEPAGKEDHTTKNFILSSSSLNHSSPDAILFKPMVDKNDGSMEVSETLKRNLDLTYIGKGAIYNDCSIIRNTVEMDIDWPNTRTQRLLILQSTRYFFSWDILSQLNIDALLCGAIPVLMSPLPLKSFEEFSQSEFGRVPFAILKNIDDNVIVEIPDCYDSDLENFRKKYFHKSENYNRHLKSVVEQMFYFFFSPDCFIHGN